MGTIDDTTLRPEQAGDHSAIRLVNEAAFGRADEADLVDHLRDEGAVLASFVAERNGRLVGHVLFSRMSIESPGASLAAVALAPVAVVPALQRQGIGDRMIRHGLEWLRQRNERVVTVLGDKHYYPRFGFSSDRARTLVTPFPADAFMVLELVPGVLDEIGGPVRYARSFGL